MSLQPQIWPLGGLKSYEKSIWWWVVGGGGGSMQPNTKTTRNSYTASEELINNIICQAPAKNNVLASWRWAYQYNLFKVHFDCFNVPITLLPFRRTSLCFWYRSTWSLTYTCQYNSFIQSHKDDNLKTIGTFNLWTFTQAFAPSKLEKVKKCQQGRIS